jgi:hypothetical protein
MRRYRPRQCIDLSAPGWFPMHHRNLLRLVGVVLAMALAASSSLAYIHFPPPTMQKMCKQSTNIRVLVVKKHDKKKGIVVYELAETFKGENPKGMSFRHTIPVDLSGAKPIFDWVGEGKRVVMFTLEDRHSACGYVFIDRFCYSVDYNRKGDYWLLIRVDPDMAASFYGSVGTLQKVTKELLDGKEVKVPVNATVKPMPVEEREKRAHALQDVLIRNRRQ